MNDEELWLLSDGGVFCLDRISTATSAEESRRLNSKVRPQFVVLGIGVGNHQGSGQADK